MFSFFFSCVGMMLCVPFLTLFERKGLSYINNRKGPKKISIFGLMQPMVDGMKLILKEAGATLFSKKMTYLLSPMMIFFLSLSGMLIISNSKKAWIFKQKFLFFLVVVSCKIFPLFFSGLSSKSKYASLGAFRGAAQVMAYEIKVMIVLLIFFILLHSFKSFYMSKDFKFLLMVFPFLITMWLFCMVCETKRAPFDFAEGESELVSGYNTEYAGLNFTFLFLAEYTKMMLMSLVTSLLFFKKLIFWCLFFIFVFVSFRATFPRFRYDLLMIFSWKIILLMSLIFLCMSLL